MQGPVEDARTATVKLHLEPDHPSTLTPARSAGAVGRPPVMADWKEGTRAWRGPTLPGPMRLRPWRVEKQPARLRLFTLEKSRRSGFASLGDFASVHRRRGSDLIRY
jgi:hypothetical protein